MWTLHPRRAVTQITEPIVMGPPLQGAEDAAFARLCMGGKVGWG